MKAYYHIPVTPEDITKTGVTIPFGLFEFMCMPLGLGNSAQTFQRFIHQVCRGLHIVFANVDDILVVGTSGKEHHRHLRLLFEQLQSNDLVVNSVQCV